MLPHVEVDVTKPHDVIENSVIIIILFPCAGSPP